MRPRALLGVLRCLALATADCLGASSGSPSATPSSPMGSTAPPTDTDHRTATPPPPGQVDLPDGPKERPERPSVLNESSVRTYVEAYEYRYVYNTLWSGESTDVDLACRVDDVTERSWGYETVVTCTGSSTSRPPQDGTLTVQTHADWFTQSFRYSVSEDATTRVDVDDRDPVS